MSATLNIWDGDTPSLPKMKIKKSWREKLADDKGLPKVCKVTGEMTRRWGTGTFVIPAPREVDALMKQVPGAASVTINELRAALAAKHKTDIACPITTGIFSWIAAHAAAEAEPRAQNASRRYWRTLKTGGEMNPKYPGGVEGIARRLRAEGHRVIRKGKRASSLDYKQKLFTTIPLNVMQCRCRNPTCHRVCWSDFVGWLAIGRGRAGRTRDWKTNCGSKSPSGKRNWHNCAANCTEATNSRAAAEGQPRSGGKTG